MSPTSLGLSYMYYPYRAPVAPSFRVGGTEVTFEGSSHAVPEEVTSRSSSWYIDPIPSDSWRATWSRCLVPNTFPLWGSTSITLKETRDGRVPIQMLVGRACSSPGVWNPFGVRVLGLLRLMGGLRKRSCVVRDSAVWGGRFSPHTKSAVEIHGDPWSSNNDSTLQKWLPLRV